MKRVGEIMKSKNLSCHLLVLLAITSCGVDPSEDSSPQSAVEGSAGPSASNPVSPSPTAAAKTIQRATKTTFLTIAKFYDSYCLRRHTMATTTRLLKTSTMATNLMLKSTRNQVLTALPSTQAIVLLVTDLLLLVQSEERLRQITSAIGNVASMDGLSSLSSDEIQAISESLAD